MSFVLNAEARTVSGKKVQTLRNNGTVPAVLYGKGLTTTALQVNARDLDTAYRTVNKGQSFTLQVGATSYEVVIQIVQRHPLSRAIIHVDFKLA